LFLAEAGASAALGGLLFVAVSINLERIISIRSLPGAALATIVLLVAVLNGLDLRAGARAAPLGAWQRGAGGGDRRLVDRDRYLASAEA
jgi:hypothetical protein